MAQERWPTTAKLSPDEITSEADEAKDRGREILKTSRLADPAPRAIDFSYMAGATTLCCREEDPVRVVI